MTMDNLDTAIEELTQQIIQNSNTINSLSRERKDLERRLRELSLSVNFTNELIERTAQALATPDQQTALSQAIKEKRGQLAHEELRQLTKQVFPAEDGQDTGHDEGQDTTATQPKETEGKQ